MEPVEASHDAGEKVLFDGAVLPAGQTTQQDLDAVLNLIVKHTNTGPFLARRLIQQLVTSNPSPGYVARVAAVFAPGSGGDLRSVVKAIVLDPEARLGDNAAGAPTGGHLREPILFALTLLRALGASVSDNSPLVNIISPAGESLFYPPSVSNYFPMTYDLPQSGLRAPEFQILTPSTAVYRANLAFYAIFEQDSYGIADRCLGVRAVFERSQVVGRGGEPCALLRSHVAGHAAERRNRGRGCDQLFAVEPRGRRTVPGFLILPISGATMISRRHFVQMSARSVAMLGSSASLLHLSRMNAFAQTSPDYRALVCVFLYGGNDGNNTVVPMATSAYQELREGTADDGAEPVVAASSHHAVGAGLRTSSAARRLAESVSAAARRGGESERRHAGQTAPGAMNINWSTRTGPPLNLFSHMDQQVAWQTAISADNPTTGWGGRTADLVGAGPASYPTLISVSGNAVFGTGAASSPATIMPGIPAGLANPDSSDGATARLRSFGELLTFDSGTVLVRTASDTTREGLRQASLLNAALAARGSLSTPFPSSPLGQQFSEVAKVISVRQALGAGRQIFFCSLNGFDTHVSQILQQDSALLQLDQALSAFYAATQEMGVDRQVTTFTQSEFGRTLQPTTGSGTDHAWGNHHIVMGGAVRGGDVYGQFPTLALGGPDDVSKRGVWLPTLSLDQYGATLASWFGVGANNMPAIFPNHR